MSAMAVIAGAGALYSGISANQKAKKAQGLAGQAAAAGQVDIGALDAQTRAIALRNANESAELERQLTPEVAQLRTDANNRIKDGMNPSGVDEYSTNALDQLARSSSGTVDSRVGATQTPLLRAAIERAKANLSLGGQLSQETRNEVTRNGLAKAGTVGGGLGLGRDVVARDLGLSSLDMENQRLSQASALGTQELALDNADASRQFGNIQTEFGNINTAFNNRSNILNSVGMLQQIQGNQFNRAMAAGQYAQGIRQPTVGLDPSAVANLAVGNSNSAGAALSNQANISGQKGQNYMNAAGQLGGYALLAYNNNRGPATAAGGTGGYIDPSTGQWRQ